VGFVGLTKRNSTQNLERGRRRNWKLPVRTLDPAVSFLKLGGVDGLDSESLDRNTGAYHVSDRVQSANFVKENLFRSGTVNFCLSYGDPVKDGQRTFFDKRGQLAAFNQGANMGVLALGRMSVAVFVRVGVAMFVVMGMATAFVFVRMNVWLLVAGVLSVSVSVVFLMVTTVPLVFGVLMFVGGLGYLGAMIVVTRFDMGGPFMNAEFHSFDFAPLLPVEMHVKIPQVQFGEFPFQGGRFDAEVAESPNGHVTADAGEAVEIKYTHGIRKRADG